MATLFVHGAHRSVTVGPVQVTVTEPQGAPVWIGPAGRVDRISILEGGRIDASSVIRLLKSGAAVSYLDHLGRWVGTAIGRHDHAVENRVDQFRAHLDDDHRLRVARWVVKAKLEHQAATIEADFDPAQADYRLGDAPSLDHLRGIEGAAAADYFRRWSQALPEPFAYDRRTRRPPKDAVNVLLSYGYSLLLEEVIQAVVERGLDPYVGFLHAVHHGGPALALDAMEPFRSSIVDRWVLRLVNLRIVTPQDFADKSGRGLCLSPGARLRVVAQWKSTLDQRPIVRATRRSRSNRAAIRSFVGDLLAEMRAV